MPLSTLSRFLGDARDRLFAGGARPIPGATPGRRQFVRRAGGAAAALGTGLYLSDEALAASEERALARGIVPGTAVDASGRRIAESSANPYVGEIMLTPYNFAVRGWSFAHGQLIAIGSNDALFSLLGTTFGGDGRTTFGLPDLRGRFAMSAGTGPGLSPRTLGEKGGSEQFSVLTTNLPSHTHNPRSDNSPGSSRTPSGNIAAGDNTGDNIYAPTADADTQMGSTTATGGSQPIQYLSPYFVMNYQIAMFGVYPSRS